MSLLVEVFSLVLFFNLYIKNKQLFEKFVGVHDKIIKVLKVTWNKKVK